MSVYVDDLKSCLKNKKWLHDQSAHLVADSIEELHDFARRLELFRSWFQNRPMPHYDVTEGMRWKAIRQGAIAITHRELVGMIRKDKNHGR